MDTKLIQSYVLDKYFVSTILRGSSCALQPKPYYETMVWRWDSGAGTRGESVDVPLPYQSDAYTEAIDMHSEVCKWLVCTEKKANGYD